MVASFRDEGRDAQAAQVLERVRTIGQLPDAYTERRGEVTVVALGNFADPTSAEARAAMERVRAIEIEVDGQRGRPFADAVMVPPAGFAGSLPQYDLRNVRSSEGNWALYTLQVAFYGRIDGRAPTPAEMTEARKAAEEAVIRLRREGEKAFYYHGPRGSTVTIGLFGEEDYRAAEGGQRAEFESPALRVLRQRYPHNLVNGAGVRQTVTVVGPDGRPVRQQVMQPSRLVGVPNN
ncbi:hypothetical protein J4558_22520 [Leptolyngbya sp. 15MV]|nr:hypothetical protein J4558_22520 [Leptolyngbya sp. 15MV]